MKLLEKVSFNELDEELDNRGIEISSEIVEFMKDLLEDNKNIDFSYFGLRVTGCNGEVIFGESNDKGFIIYGKLTEADLDNIKIHGLTTVKSDKGYKLDGIYVENVEENTAFEHTKFW